MWLWQPLDSNYKTYHDNLSLKLWNMLLLPPIFYSFIFLSQLVLADFDTLNYIFLIYLLCYCVIFSWYIIYGDGNRILIMWMFSEYVNVFLIFLIFYFCFICWYWYNTIFIIGLCFYSILWTKCVSSTFTVSDVLKGAMFVSSMISCL